MRVALLCCLGLAVLSSSCRKKTYAEFYKLETEQSSLISRDGDDAYLSPEMETIIAGLNAVPDNAREYERARELSSKLQIEQQRMRAEREAAVVKPTEVDTSPPVPMPAAVVVPVDAPVAAAADAGPSQPYGGMPEKDFVAAFGSCFRAGAAVPGEDGGAASTQVVIDRSDCTKRFGQAGATTSYIFGSANGLQGKRTEIVTETKTEKTVVTGTPPSPPAPEGAGTIFRVTGAPVPEGYAGADAG
jgi:hypothetical protein